MDKIPQESIEFINQNYHLGIEELSKKLSIGKGTAQRYVKQARDNFESKEERIKRISTYKKKAQNSFKNNLILKTEKIAQEIFDKNKNNIYFHIGLALYWAEGRKSAFEFVNSDPLMIKGFIEWIKFFYPYKHLNLYIDVPDDGDENFCVEFWKNHLDISVFKNIKTLTSNHRMRIKTGIAKISIANKIHGSNHILKKLILLEKEYFNTMGM